jgi:hypothetical protein
MDKRPVQASRKSEAVPCVAKGALGERQDLGGLHREHAGRPATCVVEADVARFVTPSSVPLRGPGLRETREQGVVGDPDVRGEEITPPTCVDVRCSAYATLVWSRRVENCTGHGVDQLRRAVTRG